MPKQGDSLGQACTCNKYIHMHTHIHMRHFHVSVCDKSTRDHRHGEVNGSGGSRTGRFQVRAMSVYVSPTIELSAKPQMQICQSSNTAQTGEHADPDLFTQSCYTVYHFQASKERSGKPKS